MVGATQAIRAIAVMTGLVFVLGSNRLVDESESVVVTTTSDTMLAPIDVVTTTTTVAPTTTTVAPTTTTVAPDADLSPDERFIDALSRVFLDRPAIAVELADAEGGLDQRRRVLLARAAVEASPWAESNSLAGYGSDAAFEEAGATPEAFVDRLYLEVFGRPPDPSGRAFWIDQMTTQGATPGTVAEGFRASEEFRRARVERVFSDVLGRAPDPAGAAFWIERLAAVDEIELAVELASSDEFYDRAVRQER